MSSAAWMRFGQYGLPGLVLLAATILGVRLYQGHLAVERHLWISPLHDRNAHYDFALNMAVNLRNGDLAGLGHDLDGARVWGPLHGIVLAGILVVGGPSHHLAVLPSLLGWVLAAWLAFLTGRRLVPRAGNLAGAAAAFLLLISPAYRAFATDVMLESLGGCLTLLVLYAYLRTVQDRSPRAGCFLGLALTLLFLLKANYWVIVVLGLGAGEVVRQPGFYLNVFRDRILLAIPWREWLCKQARQPLTYLLVALVALALAIAITGGGIVTVLGKPISMTHPHNFVQLAYILLFARVVWWWRGTGRLWIGQFDPSVHRLIFWHLLPIGVYFLLPKRLGYFLWYVSPASANPEVDAAVSGGTEFYWNCVTSDYHLGLVVTLLVLGLTAVSLLKCRSLRPGSAGVLCFLLVSASLATLFPMHKSRFLHSWIEAAWLTTGAGLALLAGAHWRGILKPIAPALAAAAAGGLLLNLPGLIASGHAPEGGPHVMAPSSLELSDCYLPYLKDCKRTAIFSTMPLKFFASWTFLERYPDTRRLETNGGGFSSDPADLPEYVDAWLKKTRCDAVVYLDVPQKSPFYEPPWRDFNCLPGRLAASNRFQEAQRWHLPQYDCTIVLWKRKPEGEMARR